MKTVAIVLAGGTGTRFWPLSTKQRPKQLIKLYSDKTLLEETINRVDEFVDEVVISTGTHLEKAIAAITDTKQIVEPSRRDTAAAIGLCAAQYDDDILIFLPSDHFIQPREAFGATIKKAIESAKEGGIVLIGIKPTYAATGYGYLKLGEGDKLEEFKEKPDKETAQRYVEEGYLWNAGMFIAKAGVLMDQFKQHAPDIHEKLLEIKSGNLNAYNDIRKISFDFAIMEKADDVRFVPASFEWNDIGSFDALAEVLEGDNVTIGGKVFTIESSGNIVVSNKTVALVDCKDMVVVESDDNILVVPKKSVQKVKKLTESLPEELR